jgi:hypothetical protein
MIKIDSIPSLFKLVELFLLAFVCHGWMNSALFVEIGGYRLDLDAMRFTAKGNF